MKTHVSRLLGKLELRSRVQAAVLAQELGVQGIRRACTHWSRPIDAWSRPSYSRGTVGAKAQSHPPPPTPPEEARHALRTTDRTAGLTDPAAPPRRPGRPGLPRRRPPPRRPPPTPRLQDWGTGFEGKWTVKNTGTTALSSWTVEWDFPSGTAVTSAWDADVTSSGTHWTAKNKSAGTAPSPPAPPSASASTAPAPAPPPAASSTAAPVTAAASPATTPPPPPAPRPRATSPTPR